MMWQHQIWSGRVSWEGKIQVDFFCLKACRECKMGLIGKHTAHCKAN